MNTSSPLTKTRRTRASQRHDAAGLNPDSPDVPMSIGDLAKAFNMTTRAIRFYELKGLISPPRKGVARVYMRRERARLKLIQRGQNLGFTLEEIRDWLALYDADANQIAQNQHLVGLMDAAISSLSEKRADIDRSIKEMRIVRAQAIDWLSKHADKVE